MKNNKVKITIVILIISAILQSRNAISLVLNSMAMAFPDKSIESIQLIFSIMTGAVASGLALPMIMKKLNEATMTLGLVIAGAGLFCLAFSNSIVMVALCGALFGIGFGMYMPAGFTIIPESVDPAAATMAISLFTCLNTLGSMFNPYIVTSVSALFNDKVSTRFLLSGILMCLVVLMELVFIMKEKKGLTEALHG